MTAALVAAATVAVALLLRHAPSTRAVLVRRRLGRAAPPAAVDHLARRTGGRVPPAVAAGVIVLATVVAYGLVGAGATIGLVALSAASFVLARRARRGGRARSDADELVVVLERAARSLRSGASLSRALEDGLDGAGPGLRSSLGDVRSVLVAQAGFTDAVASWPVALGRDHEIAAATLGLAADLGGGRARLLDATARLLRAELDTRAEVAAAATQARMSAAVLAVAPVGFLALSVGIDPSVADTMLHTPAGRMCLVAGVMLDLIGFAVMLRTVGRAMPR
ncbi:MAG: type II secretion system F family protein [Actinomycetota bacterium]|nr:type II secretion system F family protein [Actinomycetota bacterium]